MLPTTVAPRNSAPRTVVLVCGPPGAGKTTYAHASGLEVFDFDDAKWGGDAQLFAQALDDVGTDDTARACVIRAGATISARRRAADTIRATRVVVLAVDRRECERRVAARARPRPPLRQQLAAVTSWWQQYERGDVVEPVRRTSRSW